MSGLLPLLVAALSGWGPQPGGAVQGAGGGDARAERLGSFEVELRGPVSGLELAVPGAGRAELAGSFPAGSSARFELPLPTGPLRDPTGVRPEVRHGGAGRVEVRPLPERDAARRERFESLPRGLRARAPVTPPGAGVPAPGVPALWLVAGLFALGWPLRRRGGAALALGAAGAAAVFWLARPEAAAAAFTVVEGHGPDPHLVRVEAARGRLDLGGLDDLLRLESRPPRAELVLRGTAGRADLWIDSPGAALFAFRDGQGLSLTRARNGVFDLDRVWLREAGADTWSPLGPWPRGAPLPAAPAPADAPDPPGWLIAALPQGPGILVGGGGERWLRWVDLPPPAALPGDAPGSAPEGARGEAPGTQKPTPGH